MKTIAALFVAIAFAFAPAASFAKGGKGKGHASGHSVPSNFVKK